MVVMTRFKRNALLLVYVAHSSRGFEAVLAMKRILYGLNFAPELSGFMFSSLFLPRKHSNIRVNNDQA